MSNPKKLIIGNWKMNPLQIKEAGKILKELKPMIAGTKKSEIVICPPNIFFSDIKKILKGSSKIALGVQDAFYLPVGSHTGEVSAKMAALAGAKYVILGHSEKRQLGEGNYLIAKKTLATLKAGIIPVICVGERERDGSMFYLSAVKTQIEEIFAQVPKSALSKTIIAYEPVWAIGKDAVREATPAEFLEMAIFIRKTLSQMYDMKSVKNIRIIYGGSVNPENAESFLFEGGADGLLVGRDSLNAKKFSKIINTSENHVAVN